MLKNIKSTYFNKAIFSFIDELLKLKIIKYNKTLQNLMNINLINYKLFKASEENKQEHLKTIHFTEGFSEGIAKVVEFVSSGKAIYYGEYLNNKRDGKGNE